MFLLFGLSTKQRHLGTGATRTCPRCHNTTAWAAIRRFRQFSLFFVPVLRWRRERLEVCTVCGEAVTA